MTQSTDSHETLPLTQAQFGIWLGQSINADSTRYNAAEYLEFSGKFDAVAFMAAATDVTQAASALNMAFDRDGDSPSHQRIDHELAASNSIRFVDLSAEHHPRDAAIRWMNTDRNLPLDIFIGRNYRHALIKLSDTRHFWYLCIHHVASDGYSFALLADKVLSQYQSNANTPTPADIEQYARLSDEDAAYRSSKYFVKDKDYWHSLLASAPKSVSFSYQPPSDISEKTLTAKTTITGEQLDILSQAAMTYQSSWGDLLITLVAAELHHQTGIKGTVLGMPFAGRMGSVSADLPCMHMNIVPIVADFESVESLGDLHQQLSLQIRKGRRHFRYRYEDLKHELARNTTDNKLFGPVVNILPFERRFDLTDCDVTPHTLSAGPVEDIAFTFVKQPDGGLVFSIEANSECYTDSVLSELKQRLSIAIKNIDAVLEKPLTVNTDKLSIQSSMALPEAQASTSLLQRIYQHTLSTPDALALSDAGGEAISYKALTERVNVVANAIKGFNLSPNQTVLLAIPRSQEAVITMVAVLLAGHRFVCVDPDAPLSRNSLIIEDAKPALCLYSPAINDELTQALSACPSTSVDEIDISSEESLPNLWLQADLNSMSLAYLIYTSGSTGTPKGVMISVEALNTFTLAAAADYGITASDTMLQFAPLHFDACIEEIFVSLSVGAHIVVRNDEMLESMSAFVACCQQWGISVLDLPTAFWHELALAIEEQSLTLPDSLNTVIIGGEAVKAPRVEAWRQAVSSDIKLLNTYGPSEATVVATFADLAQSRSSTTIGKPLSGRHIAVVDADLRPVPTGEEGELLLMGDGLSDGYLGLDTKTAESFVVFDFVHHPLSGQRAYRTGDRVKLNPCGNIEFLGRIDEQIKISGYRIEPGEIEHVLMTLETVDDAAITVNPHPQSGMPIMLRTWWYQISARTMISMLVTSARCSLIYSQHPCCHL
ncbi:hypothetical protein CS022_08625 [Veronia nyctiphanis]|uniref:Uncharacterized protein n=1 Tax=Veronia nyctiphanis TaxID=1278244 RepID=A0A4Q0YQX5_9GAMM|nr:amino acid adenylation domain-containing protein [Veronia nyctiphanis]RXJ73560.1 hypothetical protein CS022_08625 [Veronia nyctiphanis]